MFPDVNNKNWNNTPLRELFVILALQNSKLLRIGLISKNPPSESNSLCNELKSNKLESIIFPTHRIANRSECGLLSQSNSTKFSFHRVDQAGGINLILKASLHEKTQIP